MGRRSEPVTITDVTVDHETDMALKCIIEGKEYWIPKSQIDDDSEVSALGDEGTLVIPEWLAIEKGLA